MSTRAVAAACAAWIAVAAAACGSDTQPLEIKNVRATGTVGGLVLDAVTRAPVEGATVVLVAGEVPATGTTDATGAFALADVPAGEVAVTISADDYLSAVFHGTLAAAAGEFPVDNAALTFGPIGLVPATGTLSAMVVFDDGSPAPDLTLTARANRRFYDYSAAHNTSGYLDAQVTAVTAKTDATGKVTFTGLPDYVLLASVEDDTVTVVVPPVLAEEGSPTMYRYPGGSFVFRMLALGATTPVIVLRQPAPGSLQVVASNIQAFEGSASGTVPAVLSKTGPVWVTFNQSLDPEATKIQLLDELGATATAQVSQVASYNTLQLSFSPALEDAREYNLVIHAVAAAMGGGQVLQGDFWAPFFTAPTGTVTKPTARRDAADPSVVYLTFNEPIGTGDPASNNLTGGDCVLFFTQDLDGSNSLGDAPGETGSSTCLSWTAFTAVEPDPTGIAGLSGYTRFWRFNAPTLPGGPPPLPLPEGIPVSIVFSRVTSGAYVMKRVTGVPVPDFSGTMNILMPSL